MLQLTITVGGIERDYSKYANWKAIGIEERLNVPSTLTFFLEPSDANFSIPPNRAYVRIYSTKYGRSLYTGFISSEPQRLYKGLINPMIEPGGQHFQFQVICTSDEHILNIKAVPFIPAYVNQTQGQILSNIANVLAASGFYDTTPDVSGGFVGSGDIVPFFSYDPRRAYSEIAKEFGDGARYRYKFRDREFFYTPYGDQPLGIRYDENKPPMTLDANGLKANVLAVPTVNDVTLIGDVEGGNNREDYFVGDGFTADYPLRHKMFRGASVILMQETWNQPPGGEQWQVIEYGQQINLPESTFFDFSAGALNVITPAAASGDFLSLSGSVLSQNNGLELMGALNLEHGEFTFNDYCKGMIGGIYRDKSYTEASLLGGFELSSTGELTFPASGIGPGGIPLIGQGVGGVAIQPVWAGQPVGAPIITRPNHNYVLQTVVATPEYARYRRIYRTVEGIEFGGDQINTSGSVTFYVQDFDIIAASGALYQPEVTRISVEHTEFPVFAAYALVNNQRLNLTVTNTLIAQMPMGSLAAVMGPLGLAQPTGAILPLLPPGSGGYIGPVLPWANPASGNILPPPLPLVVTGDQLILGNGFQQQAAQITPGNEADKLDFYASGPYTIPAVGTRLRLQSWQAQAAMARLQDPISISGEAFIVGDDGIRSAIISDLNPLPRTSEDCDNAALAFLKDRVKAFYNGTYTCTSLFFEGLSSDQQFYPTVGRYLDIHAPYRGIDQQKFLVTSLRIGILDPLTELLEFQIGFGPDLYLEKMLRHFVDVHPTAVLTPTDKANPPLPRDYREASSTYLPDLNSVQIDPAYVTDTSVLLRVQTFAGAEIEVRRIDANWGRGATLDFVGSFRGSAFTLQRQHYDQTWYLRPVDHGFSPSGDIAPSGAPDPEDVKTSRRSKVIRVRAPLKPSPPECTSVTDTIIQFIYTGDIRNIYGFELRAGDDTTILVQKPVATQADLAIDLKDTPWTTLNKGQQETLYAYFFNTMWGYSERHACSPIGILPGRISYTPLLKGYGRFGIKDLTLLDGDDPKTLTEFHLVLAYVNEETCSHLFGELAEAIGNEPPGPDSGADPIIITPVIVADADFAFASGDFIVFNDPDQDPNHPEARRYECAQIMGITGDNYEIQRHYPGAETGRATFESFLTPHKAGVRFYKVQLQHFPFKLKAGAFETGDTGDLSNEHYVVWPDACVVAAIAAVANANGFGPWTVANTAIGVPAYPYPGDVHQNPPAPGMRTLTGASYMMTSQGGTLAVDDVAFVPARLQEQHAVRTVYAYLDGTDALASDLEIEVRAKEALPAGGLESDRRIGIVDTITIKAGNLQSYDADDGPLDRRMPYNHAWPTTDLDAADDSPSAGRITLDQDDDLNYRLTKVPDGAAGNLVVVVQS